MIETNKQVQQTFAELLRYVRELASYARRDELAAALTDDEQRSAYQLSDGSRNAKDIKSDGNLNCAARSIQRWWATWVDLGLAERLPHGKVRALYDVRVIPRSLPGE